MSFERSYSIESHQRIKLILIFGDKSLLLTWWVTYPVEIFTFIPNFACSLCKKNSRKIRGGVVNTLVDLTWNDPPYLFPCYKYYRYWWRALGFQPSQPYG